MNPTASLPEQEPIEHSAVTSELVVTHDQFEALAHDVMATIRDNPDGSESGWESARRAYVEEEDDPDLRTLAQILISARQASADQATMDKLRGKMSDGQKLTQEERSQQFETKATLIAYNHLIRDLFYENSPQLDVAETVDWMRKCGASDQLTASLPGLFAEVGVARLIRANFGEEAIRPSTPEEETKGVDIVVSYPDGREKKIDVKYGGQVSEIGFWSQGDAAEIGVPREELEGAKLSPDFSMQLIRELKADQQRY